MVQLTAAVPDELKHRSVLPDAVQMKHTLHAMQDRMHKLHVKRMSGGKCSVMSGIIYNDMVAALDRIAEYAFEVVEIEEELSREITGSGSH
jgi:phosphate:Na+ symporter